VLRLPFQSFFEASSLFHPLYRRSTHGPSPPDNKPIRAPLFLRKFLLIIWSHLTLFSAQRLPQPLGWFSSGRTHSFLHTLFLDMLEPGAFSKASSSAFFGRPVGNYTIFFPLLEYSYVPALTWSLGRTIIFSPTVPPGAVRAERTWADYVRPSFLSLGRRSLPHPFFFPRKVFPDTFSVRDLILTRPGVWLRSRRSPPSPLILPLFCRQRDKDVFPTLVSCSDRGLPINHSNPAFKTV